MKESLNHFLSLWWKGFAVGMTYDAKVDQLSMAASCMWLVGHPEVNETQLDVMINEWLNDTNPM